MRYFALAIAVVLVGGYVVGQQPAAERKPEAESEEEFFTVESAFERGPTEPIKAAASAVAKALAESKAPEVNPVGRYVPFGNDRMLDTTNGTLFQIEGKSWVPAVELQYLSYEILDEGK